MRARVLFAQERWRQEQINPAGFSDIFNPRDLIVATGKDQMEVLAVAEETLQSQAVALVVAVLSKPLGLREGRRLQLAAKAGGTTGLCVIPEGMGSNAAETRWQCGPVFDSNDSTLMRWEIIKNKSGTLGAWHVRWDHASRRIVVVSPAGDRSGAEDARD
ncbi:MAG: hypothetical protein AAGF36_11225 [Pseudomonadota bacterium]